MGRHFSAQEKDRIQRQLMEMGRELFGLLGLKKTTIDDLTEAVGIAKGSFYNFFDSKEVLYYRIFMEEERRLKQHAIDMLQSTEPVTPDDFQQFLFNSIRMVKDNPILRRLFQREEYEHLVRKIPREYLEQHTREDNEALSPLLEKWQKQNLLADQDIDTIISLIRALYLLALHEEEIGKNHYNETLRLLTHLVAHGLIIKD